MRINYFFCFLFINTFFISATASAQNFDETWREFLENNKISNMSTLMVPNKEHEQSDYAKYLLMNINSSFCQSDMEDAERLLAEIQAIEAEVHDFESVSSEAILVPNKSGLHARPAAVLATTWKSLHFVDC